MLTRDAIAAMLPHAGDMVLLDAVEDWSGTEIACRAASHRSPDNPLRSGGRLSVLCGVEYGAQAMALHGALVRGGEARPGVLASLRNVACHVERLDDLDPDLSVRASLVASETNSFVYGFALRAGETAVMEGRAAVFLL